MFRPVDGFHPGSVPVGTDARPKLSWCRPGRRPGRDLGPGPGRPRQPAQAASPGGRAGPVDDGRPGPVEDAGARHADGGLAALQRCDVVVKTRACPVPAEVARLSAAGIPVVGGLGLWLAEARLRRRPVRDRHQGQGTTSSLTGHLLTGLGYRAWLAATSAPRPTPGQCGRLRLLGDRGVQLPGHDLSCSPPWSRSRRCTRTISTGMGESSSTTATSCPRAPSPAPNSPWLTATAPCSASAPRCSAPGSSGSASTTTRPREELQDGPARPARRAPTAATRSSPAAAWSPSASLAPPRTTALHGAAAGYPAAAERPGSTPVGTVGGVTFVDDSLSTNVLPTLAALDAFPGRRIALIVGGHDRGIDYAPLAAGVVARDAPTYVLALPDSGPRIRAQIEAAAPAPGVGRLRGGDRLPGPGRRGSGGIPLGSARRHRAAVPGRAELRRVQGLPRPWRGAFARAVRALG